MTEELPRGWATVPLREIAEVRLGRQRSPDRATGPNMRPYMRAANVTWNGIDVSDVKEMDFTPKEFETYALKDGDVLLSEASGSADEVGKPAIWRNEVPGACFQNTLIRVRSRGPALPEYLHLHFFADARLGKFVAAGKGIGINHLGAEKMASWPTRLPPLNEQRRIVAKLEALQSRSRRAREALDAVPPLLEKLRQSILAAAFRGDLTKDWRRAERQAESSGDFLRRVCSSTPTNDDSTAHQARRERSSEGDGHVASTASLPDGWQWTSGTQVFSFVTSGSRGWAEYYADAGAPFIRIGNLDHEHIGLDLREIQHVSPPPGAEGVRTRVKADDILISITADLGMVAIVPQNIGEAYVNQHIALARPRPGFSARFLAYYLASPLDGKRLLLATNRGVTKAGLGLDDIRRVVIPVPPPDESAVIVQRLDRALGRLRSVGDDIAGMASRLAELDRSALAKAFRGELAPQDPNDEPADAMLARLKADAARAASSNKPVSRRGRRGKPPADADDAATNE